MSFLENKVCISFKTYKITLGAFMKRFKRVSAVILGFALLFSPLAPQTVAEAKVAWGIRNWLKGK